MVFCLRYSPLTPGHPQPKTLTISGSPRKGNTDFVLTEIFDKIDDEYEKN